MIIADIRYDRPGNDVEFGDSEYVLLRSNGSGTADVGGWSLEDEADHVITIPSSYVIQPGGEIGSTPVQATTRPRRTTRSWGRRSRTTAEGILRLFGIRAGRRSTHTLPEIGATEIYRTDIRSNP